MITHFGLFIPLNLSREWDKSPIPPPTADDLFLVRRGKDWGIFWSITDEEEVAPETMTSVSWLLNMAQHLGRTYVAPYGYQWGEPAVCVLMREAGASMPDLDIITRYDWKTGVKVPGCP